MKLVIYSDILNQHQAAVADELYSRLGDGFVFVELKFSMERKGSNEDYSTRPYLLKSWESSENSAKAMELAESADCCVFSGILSLPYERRRLSLGLLSFEMGERWFKKGLINLLSPRLIKWMLYYYLHGWGKKRFYKLCASAFCASDHRRIGTFRNKCYKWGYFPSFTSVRASITEHGKESLSMMWCARFIAWKHPEIPIYLAEKMKNAGYDFHINMYGTGELETAVRNLAARLSVDDCITFHGMRPNDEIHSAMRNSDIFLFTSDRNEGWGAVANESMVEACALISSDAVGSAPYLINHRVNGALFKGPYVWSSLDKPDMKSVDSLFEEVRFMVENPERLREIRKQAHESIAGLWSASNAASSLLVLAENLVKGIETPFSEGPCSKA